MMATDPPPVTPETAVTVRASPSGSLSFARTWISTLEPATTLALSYEPPAHGWARETSQPAGGFQLHRIVGIGSLTIQQRRISTRIQVEDGQLIVLGGLLHSSRSLGDTGIPYLSRIPVLGAAFRTRDDNRRQTELVMFLRPTVVRAREDVDALGREMVARLSALGLPVERVAP